MSKYSLEVIPKSDIEATKLVGIIAQALVNAGVGYEIEVWEESEERDE